MSTIEGADHESDSGTAVDPRLKVFVNYRHRDAGGWARALHTELAGAFGRENVFLDVVTLQPGVKWLREIQSYGSGSAVFLVLIGTQWAETMRDRSRLPDEDQVRNEIQLAITLGATVIPILVGGATIPSPNEVPRELERVLDHQKFDLRPETFDVDVARLIEVLEGIEREPAQPDEGDEPGEPVDDAVTSGTGPGPSEQPGLGPELDGDGMGEHFEFIVERILDGEVVPFLGSGANSSTRAERWSDPNAGCLPDAFELAEYLAKKFAVTPAPAHLAEVAQHVSMNRASRLYQTLTQSLTIRPPIAPTPVHTFLARLPARLAQLGIPEERRRPQLIVTTNYDEALERAFDNADPPVPYDLAVYMASGPDRGHFVHLPYEKDAAPEVVRDGTKYNRFKIDSWGDLTRTVIVKIHGAVDRRQGTYTWGDNYVLTEDDYIDYLSTRTVPEVVPQQILAKLRGSHLLFLGYAMRDWNLRVFLQRIFGDYPIRNASWDVQRDSDELESGYWKKLPSVERIQIPLPDYVERLGAHLERAAAATASR